MSEILFLIWILGGLVTFGLLCWADLVKRPGIDGWFNLAAAVIWPAVFAGYVFDQVRSTRR